MRTEKVGYRSSTSLSQLTTQLYKKISCDTIDAKLKPGVQLPTRVMFSLLPNSDWMSCSTASSMMSSIGECRIPPNSCFNREGLVGFGTYGVVDGGCSERILRIHVRQTHRHEKVKIFQHLWRTKNISVRSIFETGLHFCA